MFSSLSPALPGSGATVHAHRVSQPGRYVGQAPVLYGFTSYQLVCDVPLLPSPRRQVTES